MVGQPLYTMTPLCELRFTLWLFRSACSGSTATPSVRLSEGKAQARYWTRAASCQRPGPCPRRRHWRVGAQFDNRRLEVRVDEVVNLRLSIEPGTAVESVTVTAAAEQPEEKTHSAGQVVAEKAIQELSLNGRS